MGTHVRSEVLAQDWLLACCCCLSVTLPELLSSLACETSGGADLVNSNSSLIHICCLCLFGDQDVVVGQMYLVSSRTGLLFQLTQVTDEKNLLINLISLQ